MYPRARPDPEVPECAPGPAGFMEKLLLEAWLPHLKALGHFPLCSHKVKVHLEWASVGCPPVAVLPATLRQAQEEGGLILGLLGRQWGRE